MRILIDLTSLADNMSGFERFALNIAGEMVKNKDIEYTLLFKEKVYPGFGEETGNTECVVLKRRSKLFFSQISVPRALRNIRADVYFFPAFPAPFLFFSRKSVSAIHDLCCFDMPETNRWYMSLYFRILYRKAASRNKRIVTVSEFSKSRITNILKAKPENVLVIYNAVDGFLECVLPDGDAAERISRKYDLPPKYILSLSTLEPRKNLGMAVRAVSRLFGETDEDLVIAGRDGWKIKDMKNSLPEEYRPRIHMTGFIDSEDLPAIYSMADAFVFTSRYEGFGIPPLEAMAASVPVVSSDCTSMPEILKDGCIYCNPEEEKSVASAVRKCLSMSSAERENLINRGKSIAQSYSWKKSAEKLLSWFGGSTEV